MGKQQPKRKSVRDSIEKMREKEVIKMTLSTNIFLCHVVQEHLPAGQGFLLGKSFMKRLTAICNIKYLVSASHLLLLAAEKKVNKTENLR